jgi:hypothetical protein
MFTHVDWNWHFWQGTQFMASDESTKTLKAFDSAEDCIEWLRLRGYREVAVSLDRAWEKANGSTIRRSFGSFG